MSGKPAIKPTSSPCPECGGDRVLAEGLNTMRVARADVGPIRKGLSGNGSEFWALVCVRCGHSTLYAKSPSRLAG